ncbi:hypothetical protein Ccrd_009459 [Cynara cardunculus var. scolymus]|uniref:SAWADEE domain-containing protein n=1 Tax=Cynara cardunculus var. scolymus TaxID=59895 RepID=A0A103YN30_CYNCS|nr:hypothetical protein Ccrd_009459 [Cynara cardunculus var. scolymus]
MATNTDVIGADAGDLELEAMRKDDCSWHPCQVHFSPDDASLVIKYGNDRFQDTLVSEKEALMRIRVRSLPLQDDDCIHIKPGEHVVVNRNSQPEGGFFDAEVEKVLRVRHSKRMQCRCTFMIRWLHQDLNGGSLTVPSISVMRLANKSINNHPTISAFMDEMLLINSNFSSMSPELTVVNAIDLEFQDLLEKQIEGIRNSVHCSKKKIRDEILGLEVNTDEQVEGTDISVPDVREPEIQNSTKKSHLRRSNWSKEVSRRVDVKNPSSPVIPSPSTEELPENRSPLNPLAARAALASMMSKLPQSLEISLNEEERKGFTDEEEEVLKSSILARYSSSGINDFFDKLSSEAEVTTKPIRIVKKPLFSGKSKAEDSDFSTNITQVTQDKMNPEIRTRLTRATVKKVKGIPDDDKRSSCVNGNKSSTASNRRFTRSALCKEGERVTIGTTSVVEKRMSTRCKEYITSDHKVKADGSHTSKDKKTLFTMPLPVAENESKPNARRKVFSKMEEGNKGPKGIEGNTCTVDTKNSSNMRRLTRSMLNKEAANIKTETTKESGGDEFPINEVLSEGIEGILDVKMLKTTKAINLPFSTYISLSPAEGNKKRAISGGADSSEKTDSKFIDSNVDLLRTEQRNKKRNTIGENVTSDGGHNYGSKKKSLDLKKHKSAKMEKLGD